MPLPNRIAFAGYARCGKDEAARALVREGYLRHNFGDIIKAQLDQTVRKYVGFTAFTENDVQKQQIRGLLEQWGEANYDNILESYFASMMPENKYVNTRLVRVREAQKWAQEGGVIWLIDRPGVKPATDWEAERLHELIDSGYISNTISNHGSREELHRAILCP